VTINQVNVLVTGMGMTTPLGPDVESTWRALLAGESRVSILDDEWAAGLPVKIACRAYQDPAEVLSGAETRRLDRCQQFAVVAARQAWADAGAPDVDPERFAVVIGTGIGGGLTTIAQYDKITAHGARRVSPFTIQMLMPNGAAAAVALELGARGGAHAPTSACASGAEAIAVGLALLESGRADIVLAGGTEACLGQLSIAAFARMGALSQREHEPQAASRPFDAARDGFVLAEGGAAIVLERAGIARARGARAYARLAGAGMSCDALDMTNPHSQGQVRAMKEAMATADLSPSDIGHVNAHATGTQAGDGVEAEAVIEAVGDHPLVTATKSSTGHMIGGAGAVEAIFTVLSLRDSVIPATRNLDTQAADIRVNVVTGTPRKEAIDAALSNSFGFGGHNVTLALTTA
jgi:3-oxoacyl-[acyl-carrier-protein] synthase II